MKLEIIISQPSLSVKPSDNLNFSLVFGNFFKGEKGDQGEAFVYSDFTAEQLAYLKGEKGDKGEAFTYKDFSEEQLSGLKGEMGSAAAICVGKVISVASNQPATITNTGTLSDAIFDFSIPKGTDAITPIRGKDYWTQADVDAINIASQTYIDQALSTSNELVLNLIAQI